jgi:hypothetical protein
MRPSVHRSAHAALASAVALLAACSDGPTAPAASRAAVPAAAAPGAQPSGLVIPGLSPRTFTLFVNTADQPTGALVSTVTFMNAEGVARWVIDNKDGDLDARVGYYKVTLPASSKYTARVVAMHPSYSPDDTFRELTPSVPQPETLAFDKITLKLSPRISVALWKGGKPFAGQTVRVSEIGGGGYSDLVTDGSVSDSDFDYTAALNDGKIQYWLPRFGTYTVCPVSVPAGLSASCITLVASAYGAQYNGSITYASRMMK